MANGMRSLYSVLHLVAGTSLALMPLSAHSAAWTFAPLLDTSVTYADNITLVENGKEADTVLGVRPAINVNAKGSRLDLGLMYQVDSRYYLQHSGNNNYHQLMGANIDTVLVPDLLFLNGTGSLSHQAIDTKTSAGLGGLAVTENAGDVATWTLSPYVERALGTAAKIKAGFKSEFVDYTGVSRDSFSRERFVDVGSGSYYQKFAWDFSITDKTIYYGGVESDVTLLEKKLKLSYQFLPAWAVVGNAGQIHYNYVYDPTIAATPSGNLWRVGVAWTPSSRTVVEVGAGEHFFGSTRYGKFLHQGRLTHVEAGYDETVSSQRQLQLEFAQKGTIDPVTQTPIPADARYLVEVTEVFISKRGSLEWGYKSPRMGFTVSAYQDRRFFQFTHGKETVLGGETILEWISSPRVSMTLLYGRDSTSLIDGNKASNRNTAFSVRRIFSSRFYVSFEGRRGQFSSTDPAVTDSVAHLLTARAVLTF